MDKTLRILILEDNPADAELIEFELREAGISFDGKDMAKLAIKQPPPPLPCLANRSFISAT